MANASRRGARRTDAGSHLSILRLSLCGRNYGQLDMGWMLRIVVDGVGCNRPSAIAIKRLASVGIHVEAWEIAARNVDPDAVSLLEHESMGSDIARAAIIASRGAA